MRDPGLPLVGGLAFARKPGSRQGRTKGSKHVAIASPGSAERRRREHSTALQPDQALGLQHHRQSRDFHRSSTGARSKRTGSGNPGRCGTSQNGRLGAKLCRAVRCRGVPSGDCWVDDSGFEFGPGPDRGPDLGPDGGIACLLTRWGSGRYTCDPAGRPSQGPPSSIPATGACACRLNRSLLVPR